jgi:hypothetical protein
MSFKDEIGGIIDCLIAVDSCDVTILDGDVNSYLPVKVFASIDHHGDLCLSLNYDIDEVLEEIDESGLVKYLEDRGYRVEDDS